MDSTKPKALLIFNQLWTSLETKWCAAEIHIPYTLACYIQISNTS